MPTQERRLSVIPEKIYELLYVVATNPGDERIVEVVLAELKKNIRCDNSVRAKIVEDILKTLVRAERTDLLPSLTPVFAIIVNGGPATVEWVKLFSCDVLSGEDPPC
jgi:hypothetical protein